MLERVAPAAWPAGDRWKAREQIPMNDLPWYHRGLRFQCKQCGACCTGDPGYVWVNKAEIAAMAAAIRVAVEEFERRFVRQVGVRKSLIEMPGGDCVFFHGESRTCQVYGY